MSNSKQVNIGSNIPLFFQGVYIKASENYMGGHLVKILGWGTEDGVDYWLAANSWNTYWGNLGGFFKIRRGTNECGIEEEVIGGIPEPEPKPHDFDQMGSSTDFDQWIAQ